MLPMVIFEPEDETRSLLCRYVTDYNREAGGRVSILADTDSAAETVRYMESTEGIAVWVLGLVRGDSDKRDAAMRLGLHAFRRNRDH